MNTIITIKNVSYSSFLSKFNRGFEPLINIYLNIELKTNKINISITNLYSNIFFDTHKHNIYKQLTSIVTNARNTLSISKNLSQYEEID